MVHMNLTDYYAIIKYIFADFVALKKSGILFRVPLVNDFFEEVTFVPVLQFIIYDHKGANTPSGIYGGHTKGIK